MVGNMSSGIVETSKSLQIFIAKISLISY